MHERASRPTAGDYVFHFDGTVPGPGPNERSVLPSGDYRIQLEAATDRQTQRSVVELPIRDADSVRPGVTELALLPDHISPNFDARDDVTTITYRLAKEARVSAFVDAAQADGSVKRMWMGEEVRAQA